MNNEDFNSVIWDIEYAWRYFGKDLRNEVLAALSKTPLPSRKEGDFFNADYTYCCDYSNDRYFVGNKVVYLYVGSNGLPFYVGFGDESRMLNIHSRSKSFKRKFSENGDNKVFCIANNVNSGWGLDIERFVISILLDKGFELENVSKTKIDSSEKEKLEHYLVDIKDSVNRLCSDLISICLSDGFSKDDCIHHRTYTESNMSKNLWEINGVIRTAREWCDEYGVLVSTALTRIINNGLTPLEAMTFPPAHSNRPKSQSARDYWISQGFYPGEDKSSRVVSLYWRGKIYDDNNVAEVTV